MISSFIGILFIQTALAASSFEFRQSEQVQLIPSTFNLLTFQDFYIPSNQTFLIQFSNSARIVNKNQPNFQQEIYDTISANFWFGTQISLISYENFTKVVKSHQNPDLRIANMKFNKQSMSKILWINQTMALIVINYNYRPFLGILSVQKRTISIKNLQFVSQKDYFIDIIRLTQNDVLIIYKYSLFLLNLVDFKIDYKIVDGGDNLDKSCIKTQLFPDATRQNVFIEKLLVKNGDNIQNYLREITPNGNTKFKLALKMKDYSFKCTFDFMDQNSLLMMNSSSVLINRDLNKEDLYIGNFSKKLIKGSIQAPGNHGISIKDGVYQYINYTTLSVQKVMNYTNTANESKFWPISDNKKIVFANNVVHFYTKGRYSSLDHILDCQLIQDNILFYVESYYSIRLVVLNVENMNIKELASISLSNYMISSVRLEMVRQPNRKLCLLVVSQNNSNILNEVWNYNKERNALQRVEEYSYNIPSYNRKVIPSQLSFFMEEEIISGRNVLLFSSLNGRITSLNVPSYRFAKVFQTAVVLFMENSQFKVYRFSIDVANNAIIFSKSNPVTSNISQLQQKIEQSQVVLLKDGRPSPNPQNFLIYIYDDSWSYYYNALDPIVSTSKLNQYSFSEQESQNLRVQPYILRDKLYFALPNNSFVRVIVDPTNISVNYPIAKDLTSVFKSCNKISMKYHNLLSQNLFGFKCQQQTFDKLFVYREEEILSENLNNIYKLLIYQKPLLDYDINAIEGIGVVNTKQENDYLDYYRKKIDWTIPIGNTSIICRSMNGYYLVYNSNQTFHFLDLMTNKSTEIDLNYSSSTNCKIDNTGNWVIFYNTSNLLLSVYYAKTYYKRIQFQSQIVATKYTQDKAVFRTKKDLIWLDGTLTNIHYLQRDFQKDGFFADVSSKFIAYTYSTIKEIRICQFDVSCHHPIIIQTDSRFRIYDDGKLVIYNAKKSGVFKIYKKQPISCGQGQYISNGECRKCEGNCQNCQAETGACLDCQYGDEYKIATIVLAVVLGLVLLMLPILIRSKIIKKLKRKLKKQLKKKKNHTLSIDDEPEERLLERNEGTLQQSKDSSIIDDQPPS